MSNMGYERTDKENRKLELRRLIKRARKIENDLAENSLKEYEGSRLVN